MTPDDATARIADGMGALALSLDRLRGSLMILVGLALLGMGALYWQSYNLHQQTRVIVQTNQALLTELFGRTPRQP